MTEDGNRLLRRPARGVAGRQHAPPGSRHPTPGRSRDDEDAWQRARELQQRLLHPGGFAGICFPREYGGL